jgi:SPP1 gp7 family putative phage head morphogenesis protein
MAVKLKNRYPDAIENDFVKIYNRFIDDLEDKWLDRVMIAYKGELEADSLVDETEKMKAAAVGIGAALLAKTINLWKRGIDSYNWAQYQTNLKTLSTDNLAKLRPISRASRRTTEVLKQFSDLNSKLIKEIRFDYAAAVEALTVNEVQAQVSQIAAGAVSKGDAFRTTAKKIQKETGVIRSKAEFWARDQVTKLYGQLTRSRLQDAEAPGYIWVTQADSRVRESHQPLHGQFYTWAQVSDIGLFPGEDFQCRCDMIVSFGDAMTQKQIKQDQSFMLNDRKRAQAVKKQKQINKTIKRTKKLKTVERQEKDKRIKRLNTQLKEQQIRESKAEKRLTKLMAA